MIITRWMGSWVRATTSSAFTLEGEVEDALRGWDEDVTDEQVSAVVAAYRRAINDALPDEVALCGNDFFGPAEMDSPDFVKIVDGIDFWELAEGILNPPRPTPKLDALMARPDPFAPTLTTYDVTMTVRVQGASVEDCPGLLLETMADHDEWIIQVRNLDDPTAPLEEIWMDKTTGLRSTRPTVDDEPTP